MSSPANAPGNPLARPGTPPKPASWGDDLDDWRWETDANEMLHTGLDATRKTATAWAATISVLLGAFSTVAFIKGPETFDAIGSDWAAALAAALVLASAVLAGIAIFLAALASQGTPRYASRLDGWTLKCFYRDQARKARLELAWSRALAVLAAIGVIAGVSVTWFDNLSAEPPAPKPQAAIVTVEASVLCGTLSTSNNGEVWFAVGNSKPVPISTLQPASVVPVESCPPKT
jgi:hypothetical protein